MNNKATSYLTIDLRKHCDFKRNHIPSRFKGLVVGFYILMGIITTTFAYQVFHIIFVGKEANRIRESSVELSKKIQEIKQFESGIQSQIKKANTLIYWQKDNVSGQKVLNTLLATLPKEVLLEKFSFKRNKSKHQATLVLSLQGNAWALHQEFEKVPTKLESMGLKIISLDQIEIRQGIRLKCLCQFDILEEVEV